MQKLNLKYSPELFKLTGAGNDFIVVNCFSTDQRSKWEAYFGNSNRAEVAKKLCNRNFNLGADGLIFLEPSLNFDIKWDFYNSDGSSAQMCGNAARCVGLFCKEFGFFKESFTLETLYGPVQIDTSANVDIKVKLTKAKNINSGSIEFNSKNYAYTLINSGVPHCVLEHPTLANEQLLSLAKFLNQHESFKPEATNVSFYEIISPGKIKGISFERGVNDFTLACGTGAIAMGLDYQSKNSYLKRVEIVLPGGTVFVEFSKENSILIGPATFICKARLC